MRPLLSHHLSCVLEIVGALILPVSIHKFFIRTVVVVDGVSAVCFDWQLMVHPFLN